MLTKHRVDAIESLFEASHQAFNGSDNKLGSSMLWEAAECALSIMAESRGLSCRTEDDHFDLLESLMAETGRRDDIYDLISGYLVAGYIRNNADCDFMEGYELEGSRRSVHNFVNELLPFAG